jgi:hypothetical protein
MRESESKTMQIIFALTLCGVVFHILPQVVAYWLR